jgi:hypothetical protein
MKPVGGASGLVTAFAAMATPVDRLAALVLVHARTLVVEAFRR